MFFLHLQQLYLLIQRLIPVKTAAVYDFADILQRKLQLPEEQNLLQPLQLLFALKPVPCFRHFRRLQQTNLVIMVQSAYAHSAHAAHLADRQFLHTFTNLLLSCGKYTIHYDVT